MRFNQPIRDAVFVKGIIAQELLKTTAVRTAYSEIQQPASQPATNIVNAATDGPIGHF